MDQPVGRKRRISKAREVSLPERKDPDAAPLSVHKPGCRAKIPRLDESSPPSSPRGKRSRSSDSGSAPEPHWVRCMYFTEVRAVKGVVMDWLTSSPSDCPGKRPRVLEAELSQESTIGSAPTLQDTRSMVSTLEPWQEDTEACSQEPSVQEQEEGQEDEERPRASTPDWMVTCERGFRCMACCRIFPSQEALREHAEHGVSQGFSCRVFYEEMLERRLKPSVPRRPRRCHKRERRRLMAAKKKEITEMEEACRDLEKQLQEEQQELKRLKHQVERLERKEASCGPGQRGKRLKTH